MGLTSRKKAETLEKLHYFFNHTDEYSAEPGRSLEFSEQVKSDIAEIIRDGLHKNVSNWGSRCSSARNARGYKQEHVAEFLDNNHKAIQRQETKNAPADIDPFYLEAFSLIYNQSPYELLGLESPHLRCPTAAPNGRVFKYSDIIITTLFDASDPEKISYLEAIIKIGKLKLAKYKQLINILKDTTVISQVFATDPLSKLPKDHNKWREKRVPLLLHPNECDPNEYAQRYVFWEACLVLDDLERHNPMRLHTLAQLALCDTKGATMLRGLMLDIGYPKGARSLRNYHVDKLLAPPKKRRKRKSTPVAGKYVLTVIIPDNVSKEIQNTVFYCPNRSLTGILEDGQILVHNNSSHSTIHGYSVNLTEFLLGLNYTSKSCPAADNTTQKIGMETPQQDISNADVIYKIDLQDGHIYSNDGTATLTEAQVRKIRQIIESVFSEGVYRDTLPLFYKRRFILQKPEEDV